jgi:prepilin-type processing-associated H-X9-DG protein
VVTPGSTSNGVFFVQSQVKIADITDGTSQTALFSEKLRGAGQPNPRATMFLMPSHRPTLPSVLQTCQSLNPNMAMPLVYDMGVCWAMGEESCTLYDHVSGPNTLSCQGMASFTGGGISRSVDNPPSSGHTNGVNVVFCDGSVHFINNSVALPVWWALGTRNGGEALNGDY